MVITDSGDGSNKILWVTDRDVLERMDELANEGDETYASGDGLQTQILSFPDDFDLKEWMKTNRIRLTVMKDVK